MIQALQIAALLLVAMGWALAFAHAAEYPGKMRLDQNSYFAVQTIYYPGFTIVGACEPLSAVALAAVLALTPSTTAEFWLVAAALAATVATQAVFWLVTQPVNRVWLKDQKLGAAGSRFFATGGTTTDADWKLLRDRWEGSHLARAALMSVAMILLIVAVTLPTS